MVVELSNSVLHQIPNRWKEDAQPTPLGVGTLVELATQHLEAEPIGTQHSWPWLVCNVQRNERTKYWNGFHRTIAIVVGQIL